MTETDRQTEPAVPARERNGRFAPMSCRRGIYGCADCERERAREAYRRWRAKNKETVLEYNRKFAAANPDVIANRRDRFLAKLAARGLTWAQYCAERRRARAVLSRLVELGVIEVPMNDDEPIRMKADGDGETP